VEKAQEGRVREAGLAARRERSGEAMKNPGEHRPDAGFGRWQVRISAGSNALEPRGIVNFWFSEQEYAMPGTA
jgi:hypothetical protein